MVSCRKGNGELEMEADSGIETDSGPAYSPGLFPDSSALGGLSGGVQYNGFFCRWGPDPWEL